MQWCVIVNDPEALRAHVLKVTAPDGVEAARRGTGRANRLDEKFYEGDPGIADGQHLSATWFALAFPLDDAGRLAHDHEHWPMYARSGVAADIAGKPVAFVIPEDSDTNVLFCPPNA
jgi:hypothetical protein